jgi:hypothetical protein
MSGDIPGDRAIGSKDGMRRRTIWLTVLALFLALAPWPFSTPHLFEKCELLLAGHLRAPLDVFDLVFHSSGAFLLIAERFRTRDSQ